MATKKKKAVAGGRRAAPDVMPELRRTRSRWLSRGGILRMVALLVVVLALVPAVLGLIYAFLPVHPVSTLMLGRWVTGQSVDRQWVAIGDVAPVMVNSVIMSEDGQFCSHHGVDWNEINAVVTDALEGEKTRGASTIPMQTAKNLFLWTDRSFIRKTVEIPLALYLDFIMSKKRLMEIYLNIAEWDTGVFGIEAAAQHYFGRSAAKLTRRQAALLTVTLPNPEGRNPARPSGLLNKLAAIIERRAAKAGGYVGCVQ